METPNSTKPMHIGRKICRVREQRGIKQETLATELGISQQTVSRMEHSETIEEELLAKVAEILGVSTEAIKNYSDESVIYNIQNNYEGSSSNYSGLHQCSFNPLDKLIELVEENRKLYERLLKSEKEKTDILKGKA